MVEPHVISCWDLPVLQQECRASPSECWSPVLGEWEIVFPSLSTTRRQVKLRASPFQKPCCWTGGGKGLWGCWAWAQLVWVAVTGDISFSQCEMSLQAVAEAWTRLLLDQLLCWRPVSRAGFTSPTFLLVGKMELRVSNAKMTWIQGNHCVCFLSCLKSVVEKARPHPYCYFCFRCNTHVLNLFAKPRLDKGLVPDLTITSRALGILG